MKLLLLLLFFTLLTNSFSDVSHTVDIIINLDGRAHVVEQTQISIDSEQEVYTYTTSMGAIKTTIDDWQKLTKSEFLTYHTTASPVEQRITPQKPVYNSAVQKYYSIIMFEYDTAEPIVSISETGPRKTLYRLNSSKLAFKLSPTGDIVLPKSNYLRITIPENARLISANPKPDEINGNVLIWEGPYTLARFDLRFEIEKSLGEEVQEFFTQVGQTIQSGIWNYAYIIILFFVVFVFYKMRR